MWDQLFPFVDHVKYIYKKEQHRLSLLHKLRCFEVCQCILNTAYQPQTESMLTFHVVFWSEHLTVQQKRLQTNSSVPSPTVGSLTLKEQNFRGLNISSTSPFSVTTSRKKVEFVFQSSKDK